MRRSFTARPRKISSGGIGALLASTAAYSGQFAATAAQNAFTAQFTLKF